MGRTQHSKSNFDPTSLGDAIATETSWTAVKSMAASFCTHRLTAINSTRIEFDATLKAKLFCGAVFAAGLISIGISFAIHASISDDGDLMFETLSLIQLILGSTFTLIGAGMLYRVSTPIIFDDGIGFFWRGRQAPKPFAEQNVAKRFARLNRIYALQLLSQYNRSSEEPYYSYQLNLVLQDGNRINVINHGNEKSLRSDATELAAFLGKPVWDAI